jgi:hypothetical protein
MTSIIADKRGFISGLKVAQINTEQRAVDFLRRRVQRLHDEVTRLTPVWTGHTLANWQWSTNEPAEGVVDFYGSVVEATNQLPLGVEANRAAAQAVADASLARLGMEKWTLSNMPTSIWLVCNSESAIGLELGILPGDPFVSRSPNGMLRLAIRAVVDLPG